MTFLCRSYYQLSLDQLYAIMVLRQEIFVVEQDCPYLDADGKDTDCWHLMGFDEHSKLVAYTRIVPKSISYPDYVSIGRVAIALDCRGKGLGKTLMEKSIDYCQDLFENQPIKISAQAHLETWYNGLGFTATGEKYLEDGIPHIGMKF